MQQDPISNLKAFVDMAGTLIPINTIVEQSLKNRFQESQNMDTQFGLLLNEFAALIEIFEKFDEYDDVLYQYYMKDKGVTVFTLKAVEDKNLIIINTWKSQLIQKKIDILCECLTNFYDSKKKFHHPNEHKLYEYTPKFKYLTKYYEKLKEDIHTDKSPELKGKDVTIRSGGPLFNQRPDTVNLVKKKVEITEELSSTMYENPKEVSKIINKQQKRKLKEDNASYNGKRDSKKELRKQQVALEYHNQKIARKEGQGSVHPVREVTEYNM
jgi:hypothetical protein